MQLLTKQTEYKHQPAIVFRCDYHIIWCTKYRRPVLDAPIAERLKFLIHEKQDEYGYEVLEVEIMPDHVHLVSGLSPQRAPNLIVGNIKGYTAHVLRKEYPQLRSRLPCLWTRGKFISSTGGVTLEVLKQYVESQKGV